MRLRLSTFLPLRRPPSALTSKVLGPACLALVLGAWFLATLGAAVVGAVSVDSPLLVKAISMSIEEGDQFSKSYRNSLRVTGEAKRIPLMDQGRAIALGWCRKCGDITSLDKKLKCEVCGKESESFRVVVPSDREVAERELRAAGPPPKRGLFG